MRPTTGKAQTFSLGARFDAGVPVAIRGPRRKLCSRMTSEEKERRRRPLFGLYDGFLEGERDDVYERLAVRLKWFGEDCVAAAERIRQEPRYGLDLIDHLSSVVQELDNIAGSAQAKEEAMRQVMSWRIAAEDLLHNHDERERTRSPTPTANRAA